MSSYKARLLELAESLRVEYEEIWSEDGNTHVVGNESIVDELIMLIGKLEEVEDE